MRSVACFVSVTLVCLCGAFPMQIQNDEVVDPEGQRHHHRHHHRHGGAEEDVIPDIERLRRLDELIGQVERAAMSMESLDVGDEIPGIEEALREGDRVELEDDDELAEIAQDLLHGGQEEFSMIALPYKFRRYDLNNDNFVTSLELADATGTLLEDSIEPFNRADSNGDGLLTKQELHEAPWVFDLHKKSSRNSH